MAYADTYAPDYKKYYEAALGTVKNQYQTARDDLTQQQSALGQQYQTQRNQVGAQAAQTGQTLDELNAQRGLYNSGTARTDLARNYAARDTGINDLNYQQNQASTALQNQLNQLGSQEATAIAGIQGQEGLAERDYNLQLANLLGTYGDTKTQAAKEYEQNLALQQGALTGQYNGQSTLAAQQYELAKNQYDKDYALQQGALTGNYNGQPTLASQGQSYSNQLALLQALQNYNLGVGQVTDTLPQFSGYNYGDMLKQLLASLGSAS